MRFLLGGVCKGGIEQRSRLWKLPRDKGGCCFMCGMICRRPRFWFWLEWERFLCALIRCGQENFSTCFLETLEGCCSFIREAMSRFVVVVVVVNPSCCCCRLYERYITFLWRLVRRCCPPPFVCNVLYTMSLFLLYFSLFVAVVSIDPRLIILFLCTPHRFCPFFFSQPCCCFCRYR